MSGNGYSTVPKQVAAKLHERTTKLETNKITPVKKLPQEQRLQRNAGYQLGQAMNQDRVVNGGQGELNSAMALLGQYVQPPQPGTDEFDQFAAGFAIALKEG